MALSRQMTKHQAQLVRSYLRFLELPFPDQVVTKCKFLDGQLHELHVDLVLYDANIGGTIRRVVEGHQVPTDFRYLLDYDGSLEKKLDAFMAKSPSLERSLRLHYRYLMRIKKLLSLASSAHSVSGSK